MFTINPDYRAPELRYPLGPIFFLSSDRSA